MLRGTRPPKRNRAMDWIQASRNATFTAWTHTHKKGQHK
jgi:hypothetical protein